MKREIDVTAVLAAVLFTLLQLSARPVTAQNSGATVRSFTNSAAIEIVDEQAAAPYPSTIAVSGLSGTPSRVNVTLRGLTHSYPDDLDILLESPDGQKTLLMSDAGGSFPIAEVTLTFDDTAGPIPNSMQIITGIYAPANWGSSGDKFPAPAPAGPYSAALASFNGINPNGVWSLYISDDIPGNDGSVANGWSLTIVVEPEVSPRLAISRLGPTAQISWSTNSPGYVLESSAALETFSEWQAVTNAVTTNNGEYFVTIPVTDPAQFFRLRK